MLTGGKEFQSMPMFSDDYFLYRPFELHDRSGLGWNLEAKRSKDISYKAPCEIKGKPVVGLFYTWMNYPRMEIDLSRMDTRNVETMFRAFCNSKLRRIDLSMLDKSRLLIASSMFAGCSNLMSVKFANPDKIHHIEEMKSMFFDCDGIKRIELGDFKVEGLRDINGMFRGCKNLEHIDISGFQVNKDVVYNAMFFFCDKLRTVVVGQEYLAELVSDLLDAPIIKTKTTEPIEKAILKMDLLGVPRICFLKETI